MRTRFGGVLLYSRVSVPKTAGSYPFGASFTPSGSSAATPFSALSATVRPAAPVRLQVSPATATITPGGKQAYTATGTDAYGNAVGAVSARYSIKPDGNCAGATCTATETGTHTVTATSGSVSGSATLTVSPAVTQPTTTPTVTPTLTPTPPTTTVTPTTQADLAVTESVSGASPYYYSAVSFTTTVTNLSATTGSDGVTVAVAVPAGLISPGEIASTGSYDAASGTWTIGSLAAGASATLTISGYAGDVSDGTQTVTATASATTADPNSSNNSASASEASQPAQLDAEITPLPGNPTLVDVSAPGIVGWTGSARNAENPSAPVADPADYTTSWECTTVSFNPCPDNTSTDEPNQATLEYTQSSLSIDTYSMIFMVCPSDSNYVAGCTQAEVTFSTTNSGG